MRPDDGLAQARGLAGAGRLAEALEAVERVLAQRPDDGAALALQAPLLTETGQPAAALTVFERAIALDPQNAGLHSNHGNALSRLGRSAEAVAAYGRALALDPGHLGALSNRAAMTALDCPGEALADADRALAVNPGLIAAQRHRGAALLALGRQGEALAAIDAVLAASPDDASALAQRGVALGELGRFEEGEQAFARAVAAAPDDVEHRMRWALAKLRLGDFEAGWRLYEQRPASEQFSHASAHAASAVGARIQYGLSIEDLAGRSVLVVDEQGLGDQIMFASILPDLAATARHVTCVCEPRLLSLLAASFPDIAFIPAATGQAGRFSDYDRIIALGSLGALFRNRREDFPGTPYLRPRTEVAAAWAGRLGKRTAARRIGLSWRGGSARTGAAARSLPLATLGPLLQRRDCEFVSLQYGDATAEVAEANAGLARPIRAIDAGEIDDFEQLAGLVLNLDGVLSVQTTLVHLCGALGAPCRAMIPFAPEWRYGARGRHMPWYRSVELLRQSAPGDWAGVVARANAALDGP